MYLYDRNMVPSPNHKYANSSSNLNIFNIFSFSRHRLQFCKAKRNTLAIYYFILFYLLSGDGTLLLYGGGTNSGILQIYHNGRWKSICDDGWNREEVLLLVGSWVSLIMTTIAVVKELSIVFGLMM